MKTQWCTSFINVFLILLKHIRMYVQIVHKCRIDIAQIKIQKLNTFHRKKYTYTHNVNGV